VDYQAAYNRVVPVVEGKYGVEVMISDVVDPNTGAFDGQSILIDYDQDLVHFYKAGEKKDVRSLLQRGGEALAPLPIPRFTPTKFASRWSF
jgi:hypothetical protein